MEDYDDLYPDFDAQDDEELEEGGVVEAEESQNRTFLIGTIILASVFVIAIGLVAVLLLTRNKPDTQVSDADLTNQANATLWAATQTSQFQTDTAPTPLPATNTPVPPSATPTVDMPPTATVEAGVGDVTPTETGVETTPGEGTASPEATEPATSEPGVTPTTGLIEVTPIGGTGGTDDGQGGAGDTGGDNTGTLPNTGFAGGASLAGAGVLALVLVAVVVVTRKMRLD